MPDAANNQDAAERLARIRRLWDELSVTPKDTAQYRVLIKRIRDETDAFRQAIGDERER